VAEFVGLDSVKAAVIARKAGLDAPIMRNFMIYLRFVMESSEGKVALLAHLAEALGDTQSALRIGKMAIAKGQNLITFAYPVHPFPAYTPLRAPPETAFLLGIARQETEFNRLIVSGAGAKGLLQVMPVTAKHVCHDYKLKCDIPRLLTDTSYNAMIASAYIADRMGEFGGSYVLTLAGYNAGPGRARQWIRQFGDPRDPKVDPIDWIEHIPFQETREYVSKVLANVQVYRARLGEKAPLRLSEDLTRARGSRALPSAGAEAAAEPAASAED
jgi:soluble lytic murein transglycosylase